MTNSNKHIIYLLYTNDSWIASDKLYLIKVLQFLSLDTEKCSVA